MPLFVKLPHQSKGRVVQAPARTIDIFPTIADVLGVRIPWHVDGRSLLGGFPAERDVVLIKDGGRRFVVPTARAPGPPGARAPAPAVACSDQASRCRLCTPSVRAAST